MKTKQKKNRTISQKQNRNLTNCCNHNTTAKTCRRTTDDKIFDLPRRFSKKKCLTQKIRGFSMRSSCSPYKGCKK